MNTRITATREIAQEPQSCYSCGGRVHQGDEYALVTNPSQTVPTHHYHLGCCWNPLLDLLSPTRP